MATYVIAIPGTFTEGLSGSSHSALRRELAPRHTELSRSEGLDLLTVNDDNTFAVRLEVEAPDRYEAKLKATDLVATALREAGIPEDQAPLGPAAVTGMDGED
ncbi:hypothetical protein [Actinacidiphila acidipaludis]|uniref:Uncharacterized protein n=1 Tax=Actinacidiphila acidipaludis TaxID=2873382 RepID=A0ABS7QH95_9ACTN|nr:hypothetical protein [Streptomyces acidipaludis]MBY8882545.1 hypothetical protein [Streptomyces acidipaludis]